MDGWATVAGKKPKSWLPLSRCQQYEKDLKIWNLAQCLSSRESHMLQSEGYQFWTVVEQSKVSEMALEHTNLKTLPVKNKWGDVACFMRVDPDENQEQKEKQRQPQTREQPKVATAEPLLRLSSKFDSLPEELDD